jgi:tetratricopeptide (TPR) repeat protein
VLRSLGKLDESKDAYIRARDISPEIPSIHENLGLLLVSMGEPDAAISELLQAIKLEPENASSYANLANAYSFIGEYSKAISSCEKAVELEPKRAEFHQNLGSFLQKNGDLDSALISLRRALILNPESAPIYNNIGSILNDLGRIDDAAGSYLEAHKLDPESDIIMLNLAMAMHNLKNFTEAKSLFEQLIDRDPNRYNIWVNYGNTLYELGENENALNAFNMAITLNENDSNSHRNRGLVLQRLGEWQEAMKSFNNAVSIIPDDATVLFPRGMLRLKLGDYVNGWADYEWRFESVGLDFVPGSAWQYSHWDGRSFEGKTIVVYHEQGLGDALQLLRYLPLVKERGGRLIFACGVPLMRLVENSIPEVDKVISRLENHKLRYDYHVALMSLPRIFKTELETIPPLAPLLRADESTVKFWETKIQDKDMFNIGLVWSGNPEQGDNKYRSCSLADFAPIAEIPGIQFYNLQLGEAKDQIAEQAGTMEIIDYSDSLHDMQETAALIENLDLVLTVDTSVAHLAGAMGHPVWVILWFNHCWRYLLERNDSPWYPTMKLYRQPELGDWKSVMSNVNEDLAVLVSEKNKGNH